VAEHGMATAGGKLAALEGIYIDSALMWMASKMQTMNNQLTGDNQLQVCSHHAQVSIITDPLFFRLYLCNNVRLHVTIIILARPHKATAALQCLWTATATRQPHVLCH
jgi:hypothetical protein